VEQDDENETETKQQKTTTKSEFVSPFSIWWNDYHKHKNQLDPLQKDMILQCICGMGMEEVQGRISRYTEATVVKTLEKKGIGRPSTYSNILQTIQTRQYVERKTIPGTKIPLHYTGWNISKQVPWTSYLKMIGKEVNRLICTDLGEKVCSYLETYFTPFVEYPFTADMEKALDDIAHQKAKKDILLQTWDKTITIYEEKLKQNKDESILSDTIISSNSMEKQFGMYKDKELKASNTKYGIRVQWGTTVLFLKDVKWSPTLSKEQLIVHLPNYIGMYEGKEIYVKQGMYGPYMEWGTEKISFPKTLTHIPETFETILPYLQKQKEKEGVLSSTTDEMKTWTIGKKEYMSKKGPYGWYIKCGNQFVNIPEEKKEEVWNYDEKTLKEWYQMKWDEKQEWMKKQQSTSTSSKPTTTTTSKTTPKIKKKVRQYKPEEEEEDI
jgi:topoisomerase IA-like protein